MRDAAALIAPSVTETVAALALADEDAGAVKLAERYAAAIDDAADIAAALAAVPYDEDLYKRVAALEQRVRAQAVLAELGPKLLSALEALGATPRARTAALKGGGDKGGPSKLERARQSYGA